MKKVLAPGNHALNRSPLFLPGSELRANASYVATVVQDRQSEPKAHRLAAEVFPLTRGSCDQANPNLPFLNSCNPSSANLDPQTQDSPKSCVGKEKDLIGLQLPIVSSDGTEGELLVDLQLRLVRGPFGTWEVSWSKVSEVASSLNQPPNPKSSVSLKPKPPSASQLNTSKSIFNSQPKSYQPISNLKPKPISNTKPKPISISKPKPISFTKPKPILNPKQTFGTQGPLMLSPKPRTLCLLILSPILSQPLTQSPNVNPLIIGNPKHSDPLYLIL